MVLRIYSKLKEYVNRTLDLEKERSKQVTFQNEEGEFLKSASIVEWIHQITLVQNAIKIPKM